MNTYQHFASVLSQLLGNDHAVCLTVSSSMPLSIENIGHSAEGNRLVSLCHYGAQHGDLMRDPEMVFEFHTDTTPHMAEPVSFRNDYVGLFQEVYRYDDASKKESITNSGVTRLPAGTVDTTHGTRQLSRHLTPECESAGVSEPLWASTAFVAFSRSVC